MPSPASTPMVVRPLRPAGGRGLTCHLGQMYKLRSDGRYIESPLRSIAACSLDL